MGKMKDEWFEENWGRPIDEPVWYWDADKDGDAEGNSTITFRAWDEANISDVVAGWDPRDFDSRPTTEVDNSHTDLLFSMYEIQDELADILIAKHEDYGPKNISNAPGGPLNGLNVRMYDKLARLDNLLSNNKTPKNESLRDTFIDIANYAIIGLLVIDGKWDKG